MKPPGAVNNSFHFAHTSLQTSNQEQNFTKSMEFLNNISQATLTVIFVETCIATHLQGWLNEMEQTSPWGQPPNQAAW